MTQAAAEALPPRVKEIADFLFGLAERFLQEMGSVDPLIDAFRFQATGKLAVYSVPFDRSKYPANLPSTVKKVLKQYPYAATMFEGWGRATDAVAAQDERREVVMVQIYSKEATWAATYPMTRGADGRPSVEKEEPSQVIDTYGRAGRDSARLLSDRKALDQQLAKWLSDPSENGWREKYGTVLGQCVEEAKAGYTPFIKSLLIPAAVPERVHAAYGMLARVAGSRYWVGDKTDPGASTLEYRLYGVRLALDVDPEDEDMLKHAGLLQLSLEALADDSVIFFEPHEPVLKGVGDPRFDMANGLAVAAMRARLGKRVRASLEETAPELAAEATDELNRSIDHSLTTSLRRVTVVLPFAVEMQWRDRLLWQEAHEDPEVERTLAEIRHGAFAYSTQHPAVVILGVEDYFTAVKLQARDAAEAQLQFLATRRDMGPVRETDLVGCFVAESGRGWFSIQARTEKNTVPGLVPFIQGEHWTETLQFLADRARSLELGEVRVRDSLVISEKLQTDVTGSTMAPTLQGEWVDQRVLLSPAMASVLRSVSFDLLRNAESDDPHVLALPYPHRLIRQGLADTFGRHYSSRALDAIKAAFADAAIPVENCWRRAGELMPELGELLVTMPNFARVPDPLMLSLQLHWTRSPTITTRQQLLERLAFTDIGDKLPAAAITAPFPFCYIYLTGAQLSELPQSEDGDSYRLTGAFVRQTTVGALRQLEIHPVFQDVANPLAVATERLVLQLHDGPSACEVIESALAEAQVPAEVLPSTRNSMELLLKVLFYLGSREARTVPVNERTDTLKDIGKRIPERREKLVLAARGLYDHILVGPETGLPTNGAPTGRKQTKVFVRRGHIHSYWVGAGRTTLITHVLDPVVVNKHLLGDDDAPPDPKNYRLH